ncbi:MAG TPA: family 10 glycosylhydrolase [Vicinamibacterales bacterium]|nr:family 10 glycosylhydrolase [Vicinamibacterales bacterium]
MCLRRGLAAAILLLASSASLLAQDPPELRALWVDAFHEGIRSAREADDLVAAAKRANLNTLIVQVRRRGDALYARGIEPPLDDPAYDPSFDALAYIVDAGHRAGLEVHAWINAMPVWRDETPPLDPRHVFNRHGLSAPGHENWLTSSPAGEHKFPVGYFLDPGHPAAAAYLAEVYLNIVRNYAVDGIHFDYVRYPETDERLPRGAGVGYNAANLARFRRATGRTDTPDPGDEAWMQWRRGQVTNLVRRVAIEAKAINPRIKVSAALIPWGRPPTSEKDFDNVAPMQRIFQNWHEWLEDGWLDLGIPMNYATETDDRVRGWFDGWMRWEKRHQHGRQLAVGLGAYRNMPAHTLAQVARARADDDGRVAGVSFFSYAVPAQPAAVKPGTDLPAVPVTGSDRLAFLAEGAGGSPAAFARPAPIPPMPWISRPERGWIAGTITAAMPEQADGIAVKIVRRRFWPFGNTRRTVADGNGYFGLANVKPGRYEISIESPDGSRKLEVLVSAGRVSRAAF